MTAQRAAEDFRYLVGLSGQYEGESITLSEEVIWLGRAVAGTPNTSTHLLFEDQSVSRVHGALAWVPQYKSYAFHHRSQTNPTFHNEKTVSEPILLKPGDILSFGHQKLRFEVAAASAEPSTEVEAPPQPRTIAISPQPEDTGQPSEESEESTGEIQVGSISLESKPPSQAETLDQTAVQALNLGSIGLQAETPAVEQAPVFSEPSLPPAESAPPAPVPPAPEPEPLPDHPLKVSFTVRGQTLNGSAPTSVSARFSPDHKAVSGPHQDGGEAIYFEIPARLKAEVRFEYQSDTDEVKLFVEGSRATTKRITTIDHLTLEVPIQGSGQLSLAPEDKVKHQGASFSLIAGETDKLPAASASTVEMSKETFSALKDRAHRGMLEFQTGPWKGASITITPGGEHFDVGPGSKVGPYELPLSECPICRISFEDMKPQVEVVEAADGQYVSINGELLFACQANPLVSGSGLFLGKYMLHWTQPELQSTLSKYRLKFEQNSLPISRAIVRIGTASHCEILIEGQGLSPVTGNLECTPEGFFYKHLDSAIPAQVNGEMVMKGESAKVDGGSIIQLGLGSQLELERRD